MSSASVIIACHNEGDSLLKTVESVLRSARGVDVEILIVDDASTDGSVESTRRRFSDVRVVGFPERMGCSPAKDLGARHAVGDVLLFLDGHCNPEADAVPWLVRSVAQLEGAAIITPRIAALDDLNWVNRTTEVGAGYALSLRSFEPKWIQLSELRMFGRFYESPSIIGCCLAVARETYLKMDGFDSEMAIWGAEDLDFGVRAWLLGYQVLHDPVPLIGHRFQTAFSRYSVPPAQIAANRIRMGYKIIAEEVFPLWRSQFQSLHDNDVWSQACRLFECRQLSADAQRRQLWSSATRDLTWYAERFGLAWPFGAIGSVAEH